MGVSFVSMIPTDENKPHEKQKRYTKACNFSTI